MKNILTISSGLLVLTATCALLFFGIFDLSDIPTSNRNSVPLTKVKYQEDSISIDETIVATGLDVPWEITWGPDNWIWFTEQKGLVRKVNPLTGETKIVLSIPDVHMQRAVGLLGLAIHPDVKRFPYVFFDYSYRDGPSLFLKLVRYDYDGGTLTNPKILLDKIPATETHNGSRLVFDAGGKILMTTGDIDKGRLSQDIKSPNGKILRINIDGTIPVDNPIPGNLVWSWGHRNPQGLVFGSNGHLYSAEHGDVTDDEVNLVVKGANYGWPQIQGLCDISKEKSFCTDSSVVEPLRIWTPTIAPAGIDYYNSSLIPQWKNSILVTTLKDASLRVLKLNENGTGVEKEFVYFSKKFGRLRDICISPSGDIYISTSNRDWNKTAGSGFPRNDDDRIVRLSASKTPASNSVARTKNPVGKSGVTARGMLIYGQYCESCHKSDGNGLTGVFPSLRNSPYVAGSPRDLIHVIMAGLDGEKYIQAMPAFNFLKDQEIADVLNYVQKEFGNKKPDINSHQVRKQRLELK